MVMRTGLGRTQRSSESGHQERTKTNQTVKEEKIPFFLSFSPALFQICSPISASLTLSQHCPHVYHLKKWTPKPQVYHLAEASISKEPRELSIQGGQQCPAWLPSSYMEI